MSDPQSGRSIKDEAEVRRLDEAWNEAYRRHDRSPLAGILSDDFAALTASGDPVTKVSSMADPPAAGPPVTFSDQDVRVFGDTAVGAEVVSSSSSRIGHWTSGFFVSSQNETGGGRQFQSRLLPSLVQPDKAAADDAIA